MVVKGKYYLEFKTPQEETFFLLKYSNEINKPDQPFNPEEEIELLLESWSYDDEDIDFKP